MENNNIKLIGVDYGMGRGCTVVSIMRGIYNTNMNNTININNVINELTSRALDKLGVGESVSNIVDNKDGTITVKTCKSAKLLVDAQNQPKPSTWGVESLLGFAEIVKANGGLHLDKISKIHEKNMSSEAIREKATMRAIIHEGILRQHHESNTEFPLRGKPVNTFNCFGDTATTMSQSETGYRSLLHSNTRQPKRGYGISDLLSVNMGSYIKTAAQLNTYLSILQYGTIGSFDIDVMTNKNMMKFLKRTANRHKLYLKKNK